MELKPPRADGGITHQASSEIVRALALLCAYALVSLSWCVRAVITVIGLALGAIGFVLLIPLVFTGFPELSWMLISLFGRPLVRLGTSDRWDRAEEGLLQRTRRT